MDLIGFTFTKIAGTRDRHFDFPFRTSTNIHFKEVTREKTEAIKDKDIFSIVFLSSLGYHRGNEKAKKESKEDKQAEMSYEGFITLSLSKEESKELQKSWKKEEIPEKMREPLFNFILRKTIIRALAMEDELGLPPHLSLPKVKLQQA